MTNPPLSATLDTPHPAPLAPRAARAVGIGVAAVILGTTGDALLRVRFGAGFSLWIVLLVSALLLLVHRERGHIPRALGWLALPAVFFADAFAWRDAGGLLGLDMLAILVALAMLAMAARTGGSTIRNGGFDTYIGAAILSGLSAAGGSILLIARDLNVRSSLRGDRARVLFGVLKGLALALPLLLVFGALLANADAVFERLLGRVLNVDEEVLSHIVLAAFITWISAGWLRGAFANFDEDRLAGEAARMARAVRPPALGVPEVATILGLLDLLFGAFVVVQLGYLFGGESMVRTVPGLGYAEYARRGFFELVTVLVLAFPVLLVGRAMLRPDDLRAARWFRILALVLLGLLGVVLVSAAQRLRLYVDGYGLTSDRLYASLALVWSAIVLARFGTIIARHRSGRGLAFTTLVSGWVLLAGLNILGPDTFILRTNLDRFAAGGVFDAKYAARLGGDAVPMLVPALLAERSPEAAARIQDRCPALRELHKRWGTAYAGEADLRSWNRGRRNARLAVRQNAARIDALCPAAPVAAPASPATLPGPPVPAAGQP